MNRTQELHKILEERIMVLDGATGTMIQTYNLTEEDYRGEEFKDYPSSLKGNNDLLVITQPQIMQEIHEKFLEAGADIIETNTFNANEFSMADYNMEDLVVRINKEAVKIAKKAAEKYTEMDPSKPRFVAGAIGPTNQSASISPDVNDPGFRKVSFDDLVRAYSEQARALVEAGSDILLIETAFDTLNTKAAVFAVSELFRELGKEIPLMISGTIVDMSGRNLSGQTIEAFYISMQHAPNLLSVGVNCSLGSEQMRPYISDLSRISSHYTSLYPNAGLPNEFGGYDESPEFMRQHIREYAEEGFVNIVGGCCGTTPDHIREFAKAVEGIKPRSKKELMA